MMLDYSDLDFVLVNASRRLYWKMCLVMDSKRMNEQANKRASIESHHRVEFRLTTSIFLPFFFQISTELFMTWWLLILVFLYLFEFLPSSFRYSLNALTSPPATLSLASRGVSIDLVLLTSNKHTQVSGCAAVNFYLYDVADWKWKRLIGRIVKSNV